VLSSPSETPIEKRDRALITFALLTGARISALASFQMRHLDLENRYIFQDARDVRTKHRKTFPTYFFPMGEDLVEIIADWVAHLTNEQQFGPCDPLFPATENALNDQGLFGAAGLSRRHWQQSGSIRDIFRHRFKAAGLPYFNPHSLRKTIMQEAYRRGLSIEELKAWSQNLGHEDTKTTIDSYGPVSRHRQAEILAQQTVSGDRRSDGAPTPEEIRRVLEHLNRSVS
jgi:integrase